MERVWILAGASSEELLFLQGPHVNLGPFVFTTKGLAEQTTSRPKWKNAVAHEMPAETFVRGIFDSFPPSDTDVLFLNDRPLPLSYEGAHWVDQETGTTTWTPLFRHGSMAWFDVVLEQVGLILEMAPEAIEAIGNLNAAEEDEALDDVEQARRLVQTMVRVSVIPQTNVLDDKGGLVKETLFWLYTTGMDKIGLPEMEIRDVPVWWTTAAGAELNAWAAYATRHPVNDGAILEGGGLFPLLLKASQSENIFWQQRGKKCLTLEVHHVFAPVNPPVESMVH
jgi:hypothetical protein